MTWSQTQLPWIRDPAASWGMQKLLIRPATTWCKGLSTQWPTFDSNLQAAKLLMSWSIDPILHLGRRFSIIMRKSESGDTQGIKRLDSETACHNKVWSLAGWGYDSYELESISVTGWMVGYQIEDDWGFAGTVLKLNTYACMYLCDHLCMHDWLVYFAVYVSVITHPWNQSSSTGLSVWKLDHSPSSVPLWGSLDEWTGWNRVWKCMNYYDMGSCERF